MFLAQKAMAAPAAAHTYATWNPADKSSIVTLSNGNLRAQFVTGGTAAIYGVRASLGKSSGKWYWEYTYVSASQIGMLVGVGRNTTTVDQYPGAVATSYGYYHLNGQKYNNGVGQAYGASFSVGAVIGVMLDMDAGTVEFLVNNVSQGVAFSGLSGTIYPWVGETNTSTTSVVDANFGASTFAYAVPSGFNAGVYQ